MGRNKIRFYLDVVVSHPEYTQEDYDEEIKKAEEESEKLTEWPEIL